jgi:hypothetical protein
MPEKIIKRRLQDAGDAALAPDAGRPLYESSERALGRAGASIYSRPFAAFLYLDRRAVRLRTAKTKTAVGEEAETDEDNYITARAGAGDRTHAYREASPPPRNARRFGRGSLHIPNAFEIRKALCPTPIASETRADNFAANSHERFGLGAGLAASRAARAQRGFWYAQVTRTLYDAPDGQKHFIEQVAHGHFVVAGRRAHSGFHRQQSRESFRGRAGAGCHPGCHRGRRRGRDFHRTWSRRSHRREPDEYRDSCDRRDSCARSLSFAYEPARPCMKS